MEPMTALGGAALRGASSLTSAALRHYRPVGVARVGSPEDRASSYRRLLDAATLFANCLYQLHWEVSTKGEASDGAARQLIEAGFEAEGAHNAVRLCGSVYVIAAADAIFGDHPSPGSDGFDNDLTYFHQAIAKFIDAARRDLAYDPKWWQFLRKYKEKKFRESTEVQVINVLEEDEVSEAK